MTTDFGDADNVKIEVLGFPCHFLAEQLWWWGGARHNLMENPRSRVRPRDLFSLTTTKASTGYFARSTFMPTKVYYLGEPYHSSPRRTKYPLATHDSFEEYPCLSHFLLNSLRVTRTARVSHTPWSNSGRLRFLCQTMICCSSIYTALTSVSNRSPAALAAASVSHPYYGLGNRIYSPDAS